ncbi:hypothetical protein K435DRAFT_804578 [Dendrothele bispora CBS 962.96]|uniref:Uncharacterized protein n=1 Tax=Dendrothele bispora (strain CBS 962.96) TaxID=1314807 RepID=A0A4S8LE02_DENBC|nr:hypothetical protein K435DRAFT_804578 [Dendrothele bispora CBS 962.96]
MDLTDVSVTLPEDTFVDKEEDVPERYLEYVVGVDSDFVEGEDVRGVYFDRNHNGSSLPEPIANLAAESLRTAKSVLGILVDLGRHQLLEGLVWLDFHYAHRAVLVLGAWEVGRLNAAAAVSVNGSEQGQLEGQGLDRDNGIERIRLAPTYRILMNVAMQLAYFVGLGLEETKWRRPRLKPLENKKSLGTRTY